MLLYIERGRESCKRKLGLGRDYGTDSDVVFRSVDCILWLKKREIFEMVYVELWLVKILVLGGSWEDEFKED